MHPHFEYYYYCLLPVLQLLPAHSIFFDVKKPIKTGPNVRSCSERESGLQLQLQRGFVHAYGSVVHYEGVTCQNKEVAECEAP